MAKRERKGITKTEKVKKTRKKRRGLRAFLSILIILCAAGAVFWFGWVSFNIEEGQVGVVFTKSHGYETEPLLSGEFEWRWQALLPTNLTLHLIDLETRNVSLSKEGTLPSGNLYAEMVGNNVNFNWNLKARLSYRLDPSILPSLAEAGLLSDSLESFYSEYETRLESELTRIIDTPFMTDGDASTGELLTRLEKELLENAEDIDKRIEIIDAVVLEWTTPDIKLYETSRDLYFEYMNLRQVVLSDVEDGAVRREDVQGARLDLLARYGQILADYPVLLDLFALDGNPGSSLLPPTDLE